ncbi:hypothetical protein AAD018_002945 [Aestuariibius insulae]|uniref:hypothetical protein n=1 Tax=Aestuariibius insulae TaxID=2058287 RepID=UPI00345E9FF6
MAEQSSSSDKANAAFLKNAPAVSAVSPAELIAGGAAALWMVMSVLLLVVWGIDSGIGRIFLVVAIAIYPAICIAALAIAFRAQRLAAEEAERLGAAITALRQTYLLDRQSSVGAIRPASAPVSAPRLEAAPLEVQADLPLDPAPKAAPLTTVEVIRALNFPDTAEDKVGFSALAKALRDRDFGNLVRSSQDLLTLLSQDGIYMDDLPPDRARIELWRRFAAGERGSAVGDVGGIRDQRSLDKIAARMRDDMIFRDTAHHFLRRFDQFVTDFEAEASDEELSVMAETRSARAFMLIARASGTFD